MQNKNLPNILLLITTKDQFITGELILPENLKFESLVPDNILFYILNSGFSFITLKNCEIKERKNLAFRPDKCKQIHINISSIMTVQTIESLPDNSIYKSDNDEGISRRKKTSKGKDL